MPESRCLPLLVQRKGCLEEQGRDNRGCCRLHTWGALNSDVWCTSEVMAIEETRRQELE